MSIIYDYVSSKEIAVYYANAPKGVYLGDELFPSRKRMGLDLSWIKGAKGLPVILQPSAFDAKATLRDRKGFAKVETEMPLFRESMRIGERDRQELLKFDGRSDLSMVNSLLAQIYDDAGQLVESARVSAELMRMQLISSGKMSIHDNRMIYDYDYSLSSDNKVTLAGSDLWSDPTAPVIEQLEAWQDSIENKTGIRPTRMVLNRNTFKLLRNNTDLKSYIYPGMDPTKVKLTEDAIKETIKGILGITIAIYSAKYDDGTGTSTFFYPDNKITLLPENPIGSTWYGTTPEEADLMTSTDAQVSIVNTGIAITTIKEPHPVNVQTIVSGIFLPSGEGLDNIFIATVA